MGKCRSPAWTSCKTGMGLQNRNLCFDKLICQNKELGSGGRQALAGPIAAVLLRARPSSSLVLGVRRD